MSHVIRYFILANSWFSIEDLGVLSVILDYDYAHCTSHIIRYYDVRHLGLVELEVKKEYRLIVGLGS